MHVRDSGPVHEPLNTEIRVSRVVLVARSLYRNTDTGPYLVRSSVQRHACHIRAAGAWGWACSIVSSLSSIIFAKIANKSPPRAFTAEKTNGSSCPYS